MSATWQRNDTQRFLNNSLFLHNETYTFRHYLARFQYISGIYICSMVGPAVHEVFAFWLEWNRNRVCGISCANVPLFAMVINIHYGRPGRAQFSVSNMNPKNGDNNPVCSLFVWFVWFAFSYIYIWMNVKDYIVWPRRMFHIWVSLDSMRWVFVYSVYACLCANEHRLWVLSVSKTASYIQPFSFTVQSDRINTSFSGWPSSILCLCASFCTLFMWVLLDDKFHYIW